MDGQTSVLVFHSLKTSKRYGAKVRTGCTTCKTRRIKCDEGKPACSRCTSTGRACGGYGERGTPPQSRRSSPSAISPSQPTLLPQSWSGDGLPYLDFYYHCAVRSLSNRFDNGFWSRTALQMARSEPSIHHALIALGYLAKTETGNLKHAHSRLHHPDKALYQYHSKAVTLLAKRMTEQSFTVEVGLVACLIFVCIEFMRGNFRTAFTHLYSGLKIVSELPSIQAHGLHPRMPSHPSPVKGTLEVTKPSDLLKETLIPMFMRNVTPAMLFGSRIEEIFEFPVPHPSTYDSPISTLNDLQTLCYQICNASALFARRMATQVFVKMPLTQGDFLQQSKLLEAHHMWLKALQKFETSKVMTNEEEIMAASLKMKHYSMYILIDCSMSLRQTDFDRHLLHFHEINRNAKIVLDSMGLVEQMRNPSSGRKEPGNPDSCGAKSTPSAGAHFTFENSVVPPLYLVATRCRCPLTRREAVALLETNPPREGLWDVETHIAVAKRVIEIEETILDPATGWPAERSRLWCSVHDDRGYSEGKILVTFAFAEWARERATQSDDLRQIDGIDRSDAQWVEQIG